MEIFDLSGVAKVKCSRCEHQFQIDASDMDVDTIGSDERQMGPEIHFFGRLSAICVGCGNIIDVEYDASEYPVGVANYGEVNITGGELSSGFQDVVISFEEEIYSLDDSTDLYVPDEKAVLTNLSLGVSELIAAISAQPELLYRIDPRQPPQHPAPDC